MIRVTTKKLAGIALASFCMFILCPGILGLWFSDI